MIKRIFNNERIIIAISFILFLTIYFFIRSHFNDYFTSIYVVLSCIVIMFYFYRVSGENKKINKRKTAKYLKKVFLENHNLMTDNYLILNYSRDDIRKSKDIAKNIKLNVITKNNDNSKILDALLEINDFKELSLDNFLQIDDSSIINFDNDDLVDINNAGKLYEGSRLIFIYNLFSELAQNFLNSIVNNVNKAATPLSEEIYQIKQNVNNFLVDITKWKDELNNEKSDKNFNNVVELYNSQSEGFGILTSKISSNYTNLENDLEGINLLFQKIDHTTKDIKDIASNVNMLALNASVEAIRAGKYGAGFKVIAGETKKLSDDTRKLLENISGVVNETKGTISKMTDRVKNDLHGIIEDIDFQKHSCTSFHSILSNYYNNFNNIFSSVSTATSKIYVHIDKISPTFQLHDVIVQELSNLSTLMSKIMEENISLIDHISEDIKDESKEKIINNLITEIEKKITTDGEVEVLGGIIGKYGLKREIEVKKIETDIEFF